MKYLKLYLHILFFVSLVTACGGGCGCAYLIGHPSDVSEIGFGRDAGTTTQVIATTPPVTSVPLPTYAADSDELAAFNLLNHERASCGYGLLSQNSQMDKAAQNHADYMILNDIQLPNEQTIYAGFTGMSLSSRLTQVGYKETSIYTYAAGTEVLTSLPNTHQLTGAGVRSVRYLLSSPFQLNGILRGHKNVGISVRPAWVIKSTLNQIMIVFDLSTPDGSSAQLPGENDVLTYPCQDTTGIVYQLDVNHTPSPVPSSRNLGVRPSGHPILVTVKHGNSLAILSASLIKVSTGASIPLMAPVTHLESGFYLYANEGFILPDVPLEPSTQYQATINGTNNGLPFTRTFTYTTGAGL